VEDDVELSLPDTLTMLRMTRYLNHQYNNYRELRWMRSNDTNEMLKQHKPGATPGLSLGDDTVDIDVGAQFVVFHTAQNQLNKPAQRRI
jgi:hypothetical protein